jgi:hypothetical protein
MEACAGAHHWARLLTSLGHDVRLMPPAFVKAYVRRQKNDMADAAICEAVTCPSMRFVPIKSEEQQALLLVLLNLSPQAQRTERLLNYDANLTLDNVGASATPRSAAFGTRWSAMRRPATCSATSRPRCSTSTTPPPGCWAGWACVTASRCRTRTAASCSTTSATLWGCRGSGWTGA